MLLFTQIFGIAQYPCAALGNDVLQYDILGSGSCPQGDRQPENTTSMSSKLIPDI